MITVINASFYGGDKRLQSVVDQPKYPGVEYVMYTNKPETVRGTVWKVGDMEGEEDSPRLTARKIKSLPHIYHPDSAYWLWIDSNVELRVDPNVLVEKYLTKHNMCVLPHPERNNWVEEAEVVAGTRDEVENVQRAVDKYYSEGFIPTTLYETSCLLRSNCREIETFNIDWWYEIKHNSIRDQLSFPYCAWKNGVAINTFPGTNSVNAMRYQNKPYIPQWEEAVRAWN